MCNPREKNPTLTGDNTETKARKVITHLLFCWIESQCSHDVRYLRQGDLGGYLSCICSVHTLAAIRKVH